MTAKPLFIINFKLYEQSVGENAIKLAKEIEAAAKVKGANVIICVPATEIARVASAVKLPVYAQHCDPVKPGAHTGWLSPQALLTAGAKGTLINHSEHRIGDDVEKAVHAAKDAGLQVILCAKDTTEVKILRNLPADYIAIEPPELIGGDISISTARPELITSSVKHCPDKLLIGAGVKTHDDVEIGLKLGAKGVLVASGIVKASKVKEACFELFGGW